MTVIDTHQHFWKYSPQRDGWITDDMKVLRRDYLPKDIKAEMADVGVHRCIAVQADQSMDETKFLLSLADTHDFISGVVGWVDLRSDDLPGILSSLKVYPKLKGFRHIIQEEPALLEDKKFVEGVSALSDYNFTYDLLIYYSQMDSAVRFVNAVSSDSKIVVDHMAKPSVRTMEFDIWAKGMKSLSQNENIYCKISGMITEANWQKWTSDDFLPYMEFALETFGPSRLMYGSDWPVCLVAGSYRDQWNLVNNFISKLAKDEQKQIFGENAKRFYKL